MMVSFIESQSISHFYYFGLRGHLGTQDVITKFINVFAAKLDKNEDVSAIFLDTPKAFDSIN